MLQYWRQYGRMHGSLHVLLVGTCSSRGCGAVSRWGAPGTGVCVQHMQVRVAVHLLQQAAFVIVQGSVEIGAKCLNMRLHGGLVPNRR